MRFTDVKLTCGGDGKMSVGLSSTPGGADRITVGLADGSIFDAVHIPIDSFCNDFIPTTGIHITFGLQYTGDRGEEQNAAKSPCITQSKVQYTQFETGNLLVSAFEGEIKKAIHQRLDDTVIDVIYTKSPGRCARWREMP